MKTEVMDSGPRSARRKEHSSQPPPPLAREQEAHRRAFAWARDLALPHHLAAAHEGADRPARHLEPVERRPAAARADPFVRDRLLAPEIDHGEIGVEARSEER